MSKLFQNFYKKSSIWFTSISLIYVLLNTIFSLESFSLFLIFFISIVFGILQMWVEHKRFLNSDKELNVQIKEFQNNKQRESKELKKTNKRLTTPEFDKMKIQPGIINTLFMFAIVNPKFKTIIEQRNMGVDVSDEDGNVIFKQVRISIPSKIIITKEEKPEERLFTIGIAE